MRLRALAPLVCAALAGGCATFAPPHDAARLESAPAPLRECAEWYRALDERVAAAGVRDAQDARVPGYPYLRVSRLLASLRPAERASESALRPLAERMLALDIEARRYEIMNLPAGQRPERQRARQCGGLLLDADLADPAARAALLQRAEVPDDYRLVNRIVGLYWLTRLPFAEGVRRFQEETLAEFRREPALPEGARLVRYAPEPGLPLSRLRTAMLLARAAENPLGIPEPAAGDLEALLAANAPRLEVEVTGEYDRFGALRWPGDGESPGVDGAQPVVYGHPAWTRYAGKVLLQLVYTLWFPERPPQSDGDILAGKLDGVTWRVTLAPDGEPLVYDAIHPCGCYHLFFPTPRAAALPAPDGLQEWMFAPQSLPRLAEGERPLLRIASGTHYLKRVSMTSGADGALRYALRPYGELRSLERGAGARASAFGADGLIAGTERRERFVYWPMGIESAGAMRQWGRQATAFIGRRHFDDADLFERRFRFDLDPPR